MNHRILVHVIAKMIDTNQTYLLNKFINQRLT
ncbi:hypothetical protein NTGHW29_860004 [Candidatus Nitrotoga sp. HW29]|nr:hypothetical protein NTGHW29_860004 [Candidatus Nitrotoga sp. HW29]